MLINLANTDTPENQTMPSNEPLRKLVDLNLVHCPTIPLMISKTGNYKNILSITKWKSSLGNVGGINAPKKIECLCSDGKQYSQLLKGKDDLRQDAVMQQVFNIMNDLLNSSQITKKNRLNVRTYIVVPLSQRSGILEWCVNTIPLNEYLVGSRNRLGAHQRYHPKDMTPLECRKAMSVSFQNSIKLQVFKFCHHNVIFF